MLSVVKIASIWDMPDTVALEARVFIVAAYDGDVSKIISETLTTFSVNIGRGYYSYIVTGATATVSVYPQLDNWLISMGAEHDEEVLIFFPSSNGNRHKI